MESDRWEIINDLSGVEKYMAKHQMDLNRFRKNVGVGRSVCFGCVYKRCAKYGESRQGWRHPELYQMLLEFAAKHVKIPWTGIQVNQNYPAGKHRDTGNYGKSLIVACGDYSGGYLCTEIPEDPDHHTRHNVQYNPFIFNGSKTTHWVEDWTGNRYSFVFFDQDFRPKTEIDCREFKPYFDGANWWLARKELDGNWWKMDRKGKDVEIIDGFN